MTKTLYAYMNKINLKKKHNRRLPQETRTSRRQIPELKDEMEIKGKTKELLAKQLKTCERNMQELTNSIKGPNLRIMHIDEGEEVQQK
jgi:hypothetical protein